ncbi:MAG: proline racemase family protein [Marinicella sp.]
MKVVDSHTEGEPTRVVISGGPELGHGPLSERLHLLASQYDDFRQSVILEPRGSDVLVGALLLEPVDKRCITAVIFFNNTGYLGMCGHGALGVAKTLQHMGLVTTDEILIETPVGIVTVTFNELNSATIENVPSYLFLENVEIDVNGLGVVTGDVAWGGNWFFLVHESPAPLVLDNSELLTRAAKRVKEALRAQNITGADGAEIDHIEFFSDPIDPDADSRNFVLCPGDAYDRSPCGTGTSAKIAALAAKNLLQPGEQWIQESFIGSQFKASYHLNSAGQVIPFISGRAFVSAESTLLFEDEDPFRHGIKS